MYIIDNKKIDITAAEYKMYEDICFSYTRPHMKGEELFRGLFDTDNQGTIIGIRPPSTRFTSMEIIIFLFILMQSQQIRLMKNKFNDFLAESTNKIDKKILELDGCKK